jgi:hypothetical protein
VGRRSWGRLSGVAAGDAFPATTWAAFTVPAVGTIAFVVGIVGITLLGDRPVIAGISSWGALFLGILGTFAGSGLFAIATYRTAVLSRRAALLLGVGSVLPLVATSGGLPPLLLVAAFVCFTLGWFALGVQAIRLDRLATEPRPA